MKKIILVVIDGLGDRPIAELGNRTPLEAARTPNLDWLAKNGICGLVEPFQFPGQKYPHSDTAHLALFGYDPKVYYFGRGPYEAAGIGMVLQKGDVALRVNFGTVSENLKVIDRRAGRISQTQPLIRALSKIKEIKRIKFIIKKSYGHRAGLILRGKNLSAEISDGDPHRIGAKVGKVTPLKKTPRAVFTAQVLNEYLERAHQVLKNHPLNKQREKQGKLPANYLLVRGAGQMREVPAFQKMHGLKSACIAGGGLYKGIGKILGMDLLEVRGATGFPVTNLRGKFLAAKRNLNKPAPYRACSGAGYDFIFLHIKAADNLAEDGDFLGKKDFIEKVDKSIGPLLRLKHALIAITADHSTCCALKRHCSEPVPVVIFGSKKGRAKGFSERVCKKGELGKFKQINLIKKILIYAKDR